MRTCPLLFILAIISLDRIHSLQVPDRDVRLTLTQNKALCISSDGSQNTVVVAPCVEVHPHALSLFNDGEGFHMRFNDSMQCVQREADKVVLSECHAVPGQVWLETQGDEEDSVLFQGKETMTCLVSEAESGSSVALAPCNGSDPKQVFKEDFE